jgi:AraC-like DNA-binding protein
MPIFMDRHDVSEKVTAENIAQLHQADLKIQDQFGCRGLTYWFDDKRKTAFCLIEAPGIKNIIRMHKEAHGEVPHRVIEVDARLVESFLGRIEDPEKAQNTALNIINDPAFRTIMVIHIRRLFPDQLNSPKSSLHNYDETILHILNGYEGSLVKKTNDRFLTSFNSVSRAVQAAFEVQRYFKEHINKEGTDNILLKIGLSSGVPVTEKNLIFESAIKLAERICQIVKAEVIISAEVRELYNSENSVALNESGDILLLSTADEKFITLLMDYTESVWNNIDLGIDDFIRPLGCSKSQLYRKLISLTGHSPNDFIREYRLNEALVLLNKNMANISEIAYETGFSSPSYFSKIFQKRYGRSPSVYLSKKTV